jgi:hypothetical protein
MFCPTTNIFFLHVSAQRVHGIQWLLKLKPTPQPKTLPQTTLKVFLLKMLEQTHRPHGYVPYFLTELKQGLKYP